MTFFYKIAIIFVYLLDQKNIMTKFMKHINSVK